MAASAATARAASALPVDPSSSSSVPVVSAAQSDNTLEGFAVSWQAYAELASSGKTALSRRPSKPSALPASPPPPPWSSTLPFAERDLGPIPAHPGTGTAERAQEVYRKEGWLPAVAGEHEADRLRVLRRFGLQDVGQIETVDKIAETAQMVFGTKVVTVSCMLEDRGMFITTRGWRDEERDPTVPRMHVGLEASVCHHAMQKSEADGCFVIPCVREDWRFAQNPYCLPGGPINFFASANVNLPTLSYDAETGRHVPSRLPIGSLCVVDPAPRSPDAFTEKDATILKNLADLVAREFELGLERKRNAAVKKQIEYQGQLFKSLNVEPSSALAPLEAESDVFAHVADNLVALTGAAYCAIIDLRSYHAPVAPPPRRASATTLSATTPDSSTTSDPLVFPPPTRPSLVRSNSTETSLTTQSSGTTGGRAPSAAISTTGSTASSSTPSATRTFESQHADEFMARLSSRRGRRSSEGHLSILDSAVARDQSAGTAEVEWDWDEALGVGAEEGVRSGDEADDEEVTREKAQRAAERQGRASDAKRAVSGFLVDYFRTHRAHFDASSPSPGALAPILPPSTTAYLSVPCFFDGEPTLMIVLGSKTRHFQFEEADRDFVSNVGAVLVGSLLRRRLLEADKAKLHFLSQISHELRTPLHGIGSYLELAREVADPQALASINPLLSMADVCVNSLREVMDSVLSFSKLASNDVSAVLSGQSTISPGVRSSGPIRALVDLESLLVDIVKSCWVGSFNKRRALQASAGTEKKVPEPEDAVDIILEYDLPRGTMVLVDVGAIKRVLINLVSNALKYTDKGKIVIAVSAPLLSSRSGITEVLLDVADTGRGMSPAFVRDHLFLPFAQEDPFKEGNGLGTSIADSLLRGMGGTLRYSSAVGVGTTASVAVPLEVNVPPSTSLPTRPPPQEESFGKLRPSRPSIERRVLSDELTALLNPTALGSSKSAATSPSLHLPPPSVLPPYTPPLSPPPSAEASPTTPPAGIPPPQAPADEFTVLVADDNVVARRVLTTFLKSRKVAFVEVENGAQAVEKYLEHRPALCWMDVQMPEKDGLTASREIRDLEEEKGWQKARIVAISGLSSSLGKHSSSLERGDIDLWITKSGSLKQLSADLEAYRTAFTSASSKPTAN